MNKLKYIIIGLIIITVPEVGFTQVPKMKLPQNLSKAIIKLNQIKDKISNNDKIDDQKKTEILAQLDEEIDWTEAKQAEAQAIDNPEEMKELAKEVHTHVQEQKKKITPPKQPPFKKIKDIVPKIDKIIQDLKAEGYETSSLEEKLEEFKTASIAAKEKFEQAQASGDREALEATKGDLEALKQMAGEFKEEFNNLINN